MSVRRTQGSPLISLAPFIAFLTPNTHKCMEDNLTTDFELTNINSKMQNYVSSAVVGKDPINALLLDDIFVPKEGWLWDYKAAVSDDAASQAKTILQIVSFYNTCGGYIIYGVKEEEKDKSFVPHKCDLSGFNPAQLRDKIKQYTNDMIDFSFREIELIINDVSMMFGVLYIPKRPYSKNPVSFIKNGPEKKKGKLVFSREDVYLRIQDECVKASEVSDWQLLFSPREFDSSYGVDFSSNVNEVKSLAHNLPDRNLIFTKFIGRQSVLSLLWEWLSDDFEYTKILSGDGGKGKTSIAYQFCKSFLQAPPLGYERVVWLSAKERQFSGIHNEYYELNESDFNNAMSFLSCLADNCAIDSDDYENVSAKVIKKELKDALIMFPALIVVDDIDSLNDDEQRKVVDTCRHLGSDKVRFLITTRKKLAYSSDLCIDVPGLPLSEFGEYIDSILNRYGLKKIKQSEVEKLHRACDGSPLLSSSILRLYKYSSSLSMAINEWAGQAGEDARDAALKREIDQLTADSKRVLLAINYFKSCSYTELRQAVGFEKLRLDDCIEELQSLFLVNEPKIIESESRFSISNSTSIMVGDLASRLVVDFNKLKHQVEKLRDGGGSKKVGNRKKIGLAINQAMALLKDENYKDALETIDNELKSFKEHPDLLLMKARCLLKQSDPDYENARKILLKAVEKGQKKELAFELWYEVELAYGSPNGMIDCASKALEQHNIDGDQWMERQARGYLLRSKNRGDDGYVDDLIEASKSLSKTLKHKHRASRDFRVQQLNVLHDTIWNKLESSGKISWLSSFDIVVDLIKAGDIRTVMYKNASRCLEEAKMEPNFSGKKFEAYKICLDKFYSILNDRSSKDKIKRPFEDLLYKYKEYKKEVEE